MKRLELATAIAPPVEILPETPCSICGRPEAGLIDGRCWSCEREARSDRGEARRLAAARADRAGTLAAIGVPPVYLERPFEEPVIWPRDAKAPIDLATWTGSPWSVVLRGTVGVGKTYVAVELLWRNLLVGAQLPTARFVRASRVPGLLYGSDGSVELERLLGAQILVIDDLGLGHPKGGWEALDDLIAQRWEYRRATIITTRWTMDQIGNESSAVSAADRLAEGLVCEVQGNSRRRPPAVAGPRRSA